MFSHRLSCRTAQSASSSFWRHIVSLPDLELGPDGLAGGGFTSSSGRAQVTGGVAKTAISTGGKVQRRNLVSFLCFMNEVIFFVPGHLPTPEVSHTSFNTTAWMLTKRIIVIHHGRNVHQVKKAC